MEQQHKLSGRPRRVLTPAELPGADTWVKLDAITFSDERYLNYVPSGEGRARFYLLTPCQLRHVGWEAARARIHVQSGGETSGP